MSERIFQNLQTFLSQNGANFKILKHDPAGSSQDVAKARGTQLGQGAKALVCLVKGVDNLNFSSNAPENLKLPSDKPSTRNGRIYVIAVLRADHKANLEKLAAALGGKKASLASAEEIAQLVDCVIGSIPPFSFHDKLLLICDPKLCLGFDQIAFNAGLLDHSILLDTKDYGRIAKPMFVEFADG